MPKITQNSRRKKALLAKSKVALPKYDPLPHQIDFHQAPSKYRAVVSGVGAGKTTMGVREVLKWTQMYPGGIYVIGRLTNRSLKETTQRRFFEMCPSELIEEWSATDSHLWLKTPEPGVYSEILFMHLDEPGPLGSLDIDGFWIDEAHEPEGDEVPEETFLMLCARLRGYAGPHRGIITTNSGGKDWVWKWFFRDGRPIDVVKEYYGVTVKSDANPYLPPGYVEELRRNHPDTWVRRFLDASFDVFEGQIFTEYDEATHECEPFSIPDSWPIEAGFDFGIQMPTAVPIARIDPASGIFYITTCYYQAEADIKVVADWMKAQGLSYAWADPSTRNRGANKKSPATLYQDEGITLLPAPNDVDTKIATIHRFLIKKKLKIFKCKETEVLREELKAYRWDKQTGKPIKRDDHSVDAFGYLLMSVEDGSIGDPVKPGKKKVEAQKLADKMNMHPSLFEDEDTAFDWESEFIW